MSIANISLLIEDDYTVADLIKNLDGVDKVFVYRNGTLCKDLTIDVLHSFVKFYEITKQERHNLVKLLKGMICHVNLIPINKIENGVFSKSTNENIIKFRDYLNEHGIVATIRRELGSDIDAACGQLRRKEMKRSE